MSAKGRSTQQVIGQPTPGEESNAARNRRQRAKSEALWIDEETLGPPVVHDREESETRQPGEVSLVLEPMQFRGKFGRGDGIFLYLVEAAAVYAPRITNDARGKALPLAQAFIQPDKVERRADPGDRGHYVKPANEQQDPVAPDNRHHP